MTFDRTQHCRDQASHNRLSLDVVLDRFRETHGDLYNYDMVEYKNSHTAVTIICSSHGPFHQAPKDHWNGQGCPKCSAIARGKSRRINSDVFFDKCNEIHEGRFEYDRTSYKNMRSSIAVKCPIHGWFYPNARHHQSGASCPDCNRENMIGRGVLSLETFIERSNNIHNFRYDYSLVNLVHTKQHVEIICPEHGSFFQQPNGHMNGHGCAKCNSVMPSGMCKEWLDSIGLPDDPEHREVGDLIFGKKYVVDGYDPDTKTIYEFHGDYWHGNPDIYEAHTYSGLGQQTFGDLYNQTQNRRQEFQRSGYTVIEMWETDWLTDRCVRKFPANT